MSDNDSHIEGTRNRYLQRTGNSTSFTEYRAALEYMLNDDHSKESIQYNQDFLTELTEEIIPKIPYNNKKRDTSIGGNDALNCYYSFNEDDDIIPPYNQIGKQEHKGLGRVYDEVFQQQQKLVHMSFGIANFASLKSFYEKLIDPTLSQLINTGETESKLGVAAEFLTKSALFLWAMPVIVPMWAFNVLTGPGTSSPSKYYDFRHEMPMYFEMVNTILSNLSVSMNLAPPQNISEGEVSLREDEVKGVSHVFTKTAFDSLAILNRKHILETDDDNLSKMRTQGFWESILNEARDSSEMLTKGIKAGLTESLMYVGFRIERGAEASETFANSTKSSELENKINSTLKTNRSRIFNIAGLEKAGPLGDVIGGIAKGIQGIVNATTEMVGVTGTTELMKGAGIIDIPDVWDDSSYSTTHNFTMKLRCPSPDPLSVYYSLYVPLAFLLAAVLPRSVGPNAYTSPFLVRLYSPGLYAIPLGIIDNMTITRGGTEFGWSVDGYPTQIDINFTVKDLSKILHIPIGGGFSKNIFKDIIDVIVGQNNSFQEYMATLSNLGVMERTLASEQIKRKARIFARFTYTTKMNPLHWGFKVANTLPGRGITALNPFSGLPSSRN